MNCETCFHKEHDAGQCKKCNCGQSDLIHSSYGFINSNPIELDDYINRIYNNAETVRYHNRGHYKVCQ